VGDPRGGDRRTAAWERRGLALRARRRLVCDRARADLWRPVIAVFAFATVACTVAASLEDKVQVSSGAPIVQSPVGVTGVGDIENYFDAGLAVILLGAAVAGTVSLVMRYRRGNLVEREQLNVVALAAPFALACVVAAGNTSGVLSAVMWDVGMSAVPVAVTIAILRYRLFDVDRLISRTLVYGLLTIMLGLAYAGLVLAGQAVFSSFADGSNLAIAASTLVVAALFLPLRSRVQRFVDRRFYRRRYDMTLTLEAFSARLRHEVELDGLRADLEGVVATTMEPSHVSICLKDEEPARP
jgi:hypothetical protein